MMGAQEMAKVEYYRKVADLIASSFDMQIEIPRS